MSEEKYVVIRIRGTVNISKKIKSGLESLNLTKIHHCIVVPKNKNYEGMIGRVKDYVTWGEISKATLDKLKKAREKKKEQKVYRLSPPKKGFERKGIKKDFKKGGALGYRGEKINDLLERMI